MSWVVHIYPNCSLSSTYENLSTSRSLVTNSASSIFIWRLRWTWESLFFTCSRMDDVGNHHLKQFAKPHFRGLHKMTFASYNLDMQLVDTNNTKICEYSSFIHKKSISNLCTDKQSISHFNCSFVFWQWQSLTQEHPQNMKLKCEVQIIDMSSNLTNGFVSLWNESHDPIISFHLQIWASTNENNLKREQCTIGCTWYTTCNLSLAFHSNYLYILQAFIFPCMFLSHWNKVNAYTNSLHIWVFKYMVSNIMLLKWYHTSLKI
jgi:hypothetical protein